MAIPGCQHHAGILKGGKLSPSAKRKFIEDVMSELIYGTGGIPIPALPCGLSVPPVPYASSIELEDPDKYPQFHANVLGMYEQIALALDVQSQFTILPIVDPLAIAVKLNLNVPNLKFPGDFALYGISLPLLAIKLGLEPPELAAKIPSLISPPIPQLQLPLPIDIKLPDFDALFEFSLWPQKLPDVIVSLMTQMPSIFLKLLQFDLSAFCDAILKSKLFGGFDPNQAIVWAVASKVLVRKTAECVSIMVVASTVGSASGGITGNLGKHYGYEPMEQNYDKEKNIRNKIVDAATSMDGESWSKDKAQLRSVDNDYAAANLKYTQWLLPNVISPPPDPNKQLPTYDPTTTEKNTKKAFNIAKEASSCGLFVRGCYLRAGALDPNGIHYFNIPYKAGSALEGLVRIAERRNATIPFSANNIPALKKGDAIIVQKRNQPGTEHVLILTSNFGGGKNVTAYGIQGGQIDESNAGKPTAIANNRFQFFTKNGRVIAGEDISTARDVLRLIDAEKICKNDQD